MLKQLAQLAHLTVSSEYTDKSGWTFKKKKLIDGKTMDTKYETDFKQNCFHSEV